MITLMIVEDEPPILRSIKNLIEGISDQYKVVACAYNGHEAISILHNIAPDILLTDINMSGVDGLELISHIRKNHPDIIPVILSGHQEFEYAKRALQLGVSDYLLKPVSLSELTNLLDKLNSKIEKNITENVKSYLDGILNNNTFTGLPGSGLLNYPYYLPMLACAGSFPVFSMDLLSPAKEFWNQPELEGELSSFLDIDEQVWLFDGKSLSEKIIIFASNDNIKEKLDKLAGRVFSHLNSGRFPITITVGRFLHNVTELGIASQLLRCVSNKRLIIGHPQIIKQDISELDTDENKYHYAVIDQGIEKKLSFFFEHGKSDMFKSELKKLFLSWHEAKYPQIIVEKMIKYIIAFCQRLIPVTSSYSPSNMELQIDESIYYSSSIDELFDNIYFIIDELFTSGKQKDDTVSGQHEPLMIIIEDYLKKNYSDQISNQDLSKKFGLSPSYLSFLFKNYKGMSPSEYIIFLRIERAKQLLLTGNNLLAKDISELLGFNDPHYFSKVFKKDTGYWPSEYKNRAGNTSLKVESGS